jgi:hypothetical protein
MAARTLIAYANGLRIGRLTDEKNIWSFTYDAQWGHTPDGATFSLHRRRCFIDTMVYQEISDEIVHQAMRREREHLRADSCRRNFPPARQSRGCAREQVHP